VSNFYSDNADLRFYIEDYLDWEALIAEVEFAPSDEGFESTEEAVGFYKDILELVGDFTASEIAPHVAAIDRQEPKLVDGEVVVPEQLDAIFEQIKALDLHGMCLPRERGGLNCPLLLYMVNTELFARADVSVAAHHGFHGGMAMAALVYSINEGSFDFDPETLTLKETRFDEAIAEIAAGDAWGSMDITEPDAGSDMGALRTVGEQDDEGSWFVTGQKIFITSGHGKYHFVIARTEPAAASDDPLGGLKGLSMFMVPSWEDLPDGTRRRYVTVERVEEKLGHHASVTVTVNYERAPAHLIGARGEGFKHMLVLMNNARIGVGFEALGLCEAAWRMAKAYAAGRPSMGKTIDRHEMIADYLEEMETDIQGIRALAMKAAFNEELAHRKRLKLEFRVGIGGEEQAAALGREVKSLQWKSRLVTPLLKFVASERAVLMAQRNLQIHGGSGYMTEYGAEKLLRDAMVLPIYEGTSQIQALMAMKDSLLRITRKPGAFLSALADCRRVAWTSRDPLERKVARIRLLALRAQQHLMVKVAGDKLRQAGRNPAAWRAAFQDWDPKRDFSYALLHAERLTWMLVDAAICEALLEQSRSHPARREVLERYAERAEPRCRFQFERIKTTGERLLAKLEGAAAPADEAARAAK